MRNAYIGIGRGARLAVAAVVMAGAASLAGCSDWLRITDPGAVEDPELNNEESIDLMVNGVLGDFQPAFSWTAFFGGIFAGELRNHHGFFENVDIGRRAVARNNGTYAAAIYNGLHRARFQADSVASRMENLLGGQARQDLRLARVLAYGGYSYLLLGESLCQTPLRRGGDWRTSDDVWNMAIDRFVDAIAAAGTARQAAETPAAQAGADSVANFARVGAARAALNLGDATRATQYAAAVEPAYVSDADQGFAFWAHYRDGNDFTSRRRLTSAFWHFVTAETWVSISGTAFENLNDIRVPRGDEPRATVQAGDWWVPRSPPSHSTFDGTLEGAVFAADADIRIASALEARYILAELEGPTGANIDFVNERRAVGGQTSLPDGVGAVEYQAVLRDQRRRDFYLDTHRLGDLRRYKAHYGIDEFPSGSYYGTDSNFGDQECFPVPLAEDN